MTDADRIALANEIFAEAHATAAAAHRHKVPEGECAYCDRERAAGNDFHPAHDASPRCESGKRAHCSCDTCF